MHSHPRFFRLSASPKLYLDAISELKESRSGWVSRFRPGTITIGVDGGTVWAPTICNQEGLLIVNESLAEEFRTSSLAGLDESYPVHLRADWPSKIHKKGLANAPSYVWFPVKADIEVDPAGFRWPSDSAVIHPNTPYRKIPVPGSHGGCDIFGVQNMNWTHIFCTFRFLELARQKRWKGFSFEPMDCPHLVRVDTSIPYLEKQWPPEGVQAHPNNLEEA